MKRLNSALQPQIEEDLNKKMVFLSGPRQVGKTTLAKKITRKHHGKYLLYDNPEDRKEILNTTFSKEKLICLDEFHKYNRWKDYLKGLYDKHQKTLDILVTGSARLDIYQQSGDSLFGRFYLHTLHPFSLAEINNQKISFPENILETHKKLPGLEDLLNYSGFPEPFLKQDKREFNRWSNQRRNLLIHEDLSQLTQIQMLGVAEKVMLLLPERIGSPFSYTSVAEDVQVSTQTIQKWLANFERLFITFKIPPYTKQITRSINKRPKYYLWNWSDLQNPGPRFENLIASHLLKATWTWNSLGYANTKLHYIQDRSGKEVDFLITKENEPWFLVEAKVSEKTISKPLEFFSQKLNIPGIQLTQAPTPTKLKNNILQTSANEWLANLP